MEVIPTIIKIGNAISTSPFIKRQIKNNGNNTTEQIIFETPHAAFIANFKILPNTINIKIIKTNVNIFVSPFLLLIYLLYNKYKKEK